MTTDTWRYGKYREQAVAAQTAIEVAEAAQATANERVDEVRREHTLGKATRGDVQKVTWAHQRAIERTEQTKATLRRLGRLAEEATEAERALGRKRAQVAAEPFRVRAAELNAELADLFNGLSTRLAELDLEIAEWTAAAASIGGAGGSLGELHHPRYLAGGEHWREFTAGLNRLVKVYPVPPRSEETKDA